MELSQQCFLHLNFLEVIHLLQSHKCCLEMFTCIQSLAKDTITDFCILGAEFF